MTIKNQIRDNKNILCIARITFYTNFIYVSIMDEAEGLLLLYHSKIPVMPVIPFD